MALCSVQIASAADRSSDVPRHCSPFDLTIPQFGLYRDSLGTDRLLILGAHGDQRLAFYVDRRDNWRGQLQPLGDRRYRLEAENSPIVEAQCLDGRIERLVIEKAGTRTTADRVPITIEPVSVRSGDVVLNAMIFTPPEGDALPGAVYIHGSGPSQIIDFAEFGLSLAGRGIASIAYDKRGAGQSTGNWESASFSDLADDAVAVFEALRAHPRVADDRVGYIGASQGAWVGPKAAARSDPAFLVVSGGGPVSPGQQEFYRRMRLVREAGLNEAQIAAAEETLTHWFEYVRDPKAEAEAISARWARLEVAEQPWRTLIDVPSYDPTLRDWPEARRRFARELHFDPIPDYQAVRAPMLGIIGLEDQAFPVADTILAFNALPDDRHITIVGIPGADHGWFVDYGEGRRTQADEAYEAMIGWILAVTLRRR